MSNRLQRIFVIVSTVLLLSTSVNAQTISQSDASNAPAVVDVMILRPVGFVSLILGSALFLVITPIVLITRPHEIGTPFKALVGEPAKFLWMDPLGGH